MVLVDGTVLVAPTLVRQVPSDGPLEKTFAALTRDLAVVFAAGLVPAHHADHVPLAQLPVLGVVGVPVRGLGHVGGGDAGGGGGGDEPALRQGLDVPVLGLGAAQVLCLGQDVLGLGVGRGKGAAGHQLTRGGGDGRGGDHGGVPPHRGGNVGLWRNQRHLAGQEVINI